MAVTVIVLSIGFQAAAVILGLSLMRVDDRRAAWAVVAAAMGLLAAGRVVFLLYVVSGASPPPDLAAEGAILAASVCLATALAGLASSSIERRQSVDRLRASEACYRILVECAKDYAIVSMDSEGRIAEWNAGAERMFGYASAEAHGRALPSFLAPPGGSVEWTQGARQAILNCGRFEDEGWRIRKNGSRFLANVVVTALHDTADRHRGLAVVIRDVTERRNLEQQFLQAQKMETLGRLAGGVAHDFNNLLTVITGYSQILLSRMPPGQTDRAQVEEVLKAGERASALSRQLLAFSRKQVAQPVVLNLNEVVADLGRMLRRLIGEDVELVTRFKSSLGSILADRVQIEQVLMNLAVNARDAMPHGGSLTIETSDDVTDEKFAGQDPMIPGGAYVLLSVRDSGCGMDAETRSHLFEPFFTTKTEGKGTGLGLSTVHGIVKLNGGHILVDSEPGRGTTFRVYWPRVTNRPADAAPKSPRPEPGRASETILLVEDEDAVRDLARCVLRERGYTVLEASCGDEALSISGRRAEPVNLLLTDLVMPQMDGVELAKRIVERWPGMKVLFMSGHSESEIARRGIVAGQSAVLYKPFPPDALVCRVLEVLASEGQRESADAIPCCPRPRPYGA